MSDKSIVRGCCEDLLSRGGTSARRHGYKSVACLVLTLLVLLLVAGQSSIAVAPKSVGDYAVRLPGARPAEPIDPSGYIQVPYHAALNPGGGEITIEAWVKRDALDRYETIVGNGHGTGYWLGFHDSGKIRFSPYGPFGSTMSESVVGSGVWTHIAVTYDGTTRRFFINGVLDKSTTIGAGPLLPSPAGQPLGIGFDRNDSFTPNFFGGWIDNVRIWNVVRNASEIKAGMFHSFGAPQPHLLAEWSLDGDAVDSAGGHNGIPVGAVTFGSDGAIPHDIRIPQVNTAPALDGSCGNTEYANATEVTVDGTTVQLLHTLDDVWVCFESPYGTSMETASVFLDPAYTRLDPAQPEHLRLTVEDDDSIEASVGTGTGSYAPTNSAQGQWDADYRQCCGEYPSRRAEFRISAGLLGGWDHVIGLALHKGTGVRGGDLWPALAVSNLPSTWSSSVLGGSGDPRTFTGRVVYQPRDSMAEPVGILGVKVDLIGSDPSGGEALLDTDKTNLNGSFHLMGEDDYTEHRIELGAPPKGYLAQKAQADPPGVAEDARTIDYGSAGPGAYANNVFTLVDALPYVVDPLHGPYFLIVAPQQIIDSDALDEFVAFKRRVGFTVEVISVETVDATFAGASRLERIRALEKDRFPVRSWGGHQYLMLIGTDDEVPFARFAFWFNGYTGGPSPVEDLGACLDPTAHSVKIVYSDWVYADLRSNFDSNGNGCLLDGPLVDEAKTPFSPGYDDPDEIPSFEAAVTVGRIPFNTKSSVHSVLTNIMHFEQGAGAFKNRALLAMSYYWMRGRYWSPEHMASPLGSYNWCPAPDSATGVHMVCAKITEDAAVFAEEMRDAFMNGLGYDSTILYEEAKVVASSPVVSPLPLTEQNLLDELEARSYGMVNVGGHGGHDGVGRAVWNDINSNTVVESPTEPIGPLSHNEIAWADLINNDGLDTLTPDNEQGSIYIMAACATGYPKKYSFGAKALEQGHAVGWIGALVGISIIAPVDSEATEQLLGENQRLGDALWQTLTRQSASGRGTARWLSTLYGDPTLSYWGNPGGQSTLAAWPMLRYDARGQGYTPLTGPEVPKKLWEYGATAPGTATLPPSPVVSNNGEVIVAHGSYVDVLREGTLFQRLDLDAAAFGTPALGADGTIYALDVTGKLYAFPYMKYKFWLTPSRSRRWKLNLGDAPSTSPVVGSDGFIAIGTIDRVLLVRPDGRLAEQVVIPARPSSVLAVDAQRRIYVAAETDYVGKVDFFCPERQTCTAEQHLFYTNSTPPLLAYGSVYVGQSNGYVLKLSSSGLEELKKFGADGKITAGPIAGPAGQVLVGTQNGTLYSLTKDLGLRWKRNIGAPVRGVPAFSGGALYVVSGNKLRAYNPFSGAPLWSRSLGSDAGDGSVAVGYGREVYVQTSSGKVFAFGEGWSSKPLLTQAEPVLTGPGLRGIKVEWMLAAPLLSTIQDSSRNAAAPQDAPLGILLQRCADDGAWEDVTVLPPGTTVFTDTGVVDDTSYAYRVQVLDAGGNDSDWTTTQEDVQSLPALPGAPVLLAVRVEAADALGLDWQPSAGGVVGAYRIEHSQNAGGPFVTTQQTGAGVTTASHGGLMPATTYFYRVIAMNAAGESAPSAVQSGTTRQRTLPAPEKVRARLLAGNQVRLSWSVPPSLSDQAGTVIEYSQAGLYGFLPLATTGVAGPYGYYPGEPNTYAYRLKFVQGDAESEYAETGLVTIAEIVRVYLPLVVKQSSALSNVIR